MGKALVVFCALALSLFVFSVAASDVVPLTVQNFKEHASEGTWLVEFFAPWCGHCKNLAPTWEKLATALKGDVNVANVDCTVHKELCTKFGVRGYPTIKLVKNGNYYDYSGHRTVEAFTAFAKEGHASAAAHPVPAELSAVTATKQDQDAVPEVVDEETPQVVTLTDSDFSQVKEGVWFVKFYAPWCGHCKNLAPTWDSFSTKTDGKFKVAKIDCTTNRASCSDYHVRGYPTLKLLRDGKAYAYSGARTESAFLSFANGGYLQAESMPIPGHVAPEQKETKKEEPAAAAASEKQVVVLTDADFEEKTASGDWFVEFYAPWCGHCKHLAPVWDSFAKAAKVNVAKVDCTVEKKLLNRFGIRGFPTLKFIKDGKVYDYRGQRTLDAFVAFAEGNGYAATTPTDLPKSASSKDEL